jgi:hypothetical protein
MKLHSFFQTPWVRLIAGVCIILVTIVACRKSNAPSSDKETPTSKPAIEKGDAKAERLRWNQRTLADAYQKAGYADPKWNAAALRALVEFGRARTHLTESNEPWDIVIATNCADAVNTGCTDPMIAYLHIRFSLDPTNSPRRFADAYSAAADRLHESSYPDIRKYYASLRAAEQLHLAAGGGTQISTNAHKYRRHAIAFLADALKDKTMPIGEVYEACDGLFGTLKWNDTQFADFYHAIESSLFENWPNESEVWLLKGRAYVEMAWHVRGGGYANTVTEAQWKLFGDRLGIAQKALEQAWKINPSDSRTACEMISVELGQGLGRDRMELWFRRAMQLDPNNYSACSAKLLYLEPKWHGSVEEMLRFGRECVDAKFWGGRVPLVLLDAHVDIQALSGDEVKQASYWKRPKVWPDIKAAFDRFFELNPDVGGWHHNYALYAYKCEQWDELNRQLALLGPISYEYFGGREEFDKMVRLAKEHPSGSTLPVQK